MVPSSSRAVADAGPQDAEHQLSPQQLLELPVFWHLTSCFVTTTVGGMYIAGTFKTFGQQSFNSEAFLASISSISAIFNAVGRIAWGSLADRFRGLYRFRLFIFDDYFSHDCMSLLGSDRCRPCTFFPFCFRSFLPHTPSRRCWERPASCCGPSRCSSSKGVTSCCTCPSPCSSSAASSQPAITA